MPRQLIRSPEHDRRRSLGMLAVDWMEHFTLHGPGDVQGERVVLDDELYGFTVDAYALARRSGRRLYDSAFFSRAKGRDKSGHAARFVLFEAFGPCRFAGWAKGGEKYRWRDWTYVYDEGEPMGRPVTYPFVRCMATEETQAGNTYDNVYYNLTEGPLGEGLPRDAAGLTRTVLPHGGEIVPSTSGDASKDGGKETFVVFDESHLYTTPVLRSMYRTVRRNAAKRKVAQPWTLETSTMFAPGEDSVAEESHNLAAQIDEGKVRSPRLLFDHREAPADVDLTDEDAILAALHEVYGPFAEVMDLRRILDEIWDPRNPVADSTRYFLNRRADAADAWVTEVEWAGALNLERQVADHETITVGFDGSRSRIKGVTDATALIGCCVSDAHLFELGVWEQPDGPAGESWRVPVSEVDAVVRETFKRYNVVGFFGDPAKWETQIAAWEATYHDRLKVKATAQHPIEYWMTGGRSVLVVRALEKFHTAVVEKELSHDGAAAFTRHVLAARRRSSKVGIQISKETPDSPRKIDAAVAAVLALQARLAAVAAGLNVPQRPVAIPGRIR